MTNNTLFIISIFDVLCIKVLLGVIVQHSEMYKRGKEKRFCGFLYVWMMNF